MPPARASNRKPGRAALVARNSCIRVQLTKAQARALIAIVEDDLEDMDPMVAAFGEAVVGAAGNAVNQLRNTLEKDEERTAYRRALIELRTGEAQ